MNMLTNPSAQMARGSLALDFDPAGGVLMPGIGAREGLLCRTSYLAAVASAIATSSSICLTGIGESRIETK